MREPQGIKVGDRVLWPGYDYGGGTKRPDRTGLVVETYDGMPSNTAPTEVFFAIRFDDTRQVERNFTDRGMLQKLKREPLHIPSVTNLDPPPTIARDKTVGDWRDHTPCNDQSCKICFNYD